jgi:hypothetical protein
MDELDLTPEVIQRSEVTRSFATVSSFTVLPMMASQKSIAGPITSIVVQCSTNALRFVLHRADMLQRQAKYSDVASSASKVDESKSTQHKSSGARYCTGLMQDHRAAEVRLAEPRGATGGAVNTASHPLINLHSSNNEGFLNL